MPRLLLMEGNPRHRRERGAERGVRTGSEIYSAAILGLFPELDIDILCAADEDAQIPGGRTFNDYDGFVVCGSTLFAADDHPFVTRQIEALKQAAEAGLPILASCWGLQIACVAAGGEVAHHPAGSEVGFAWEITRNPAGEAHPLLTRRPARFDAMCIHYDEVVRLPEGAVLLASNAHSRVQAAIVPLGKTEIWAVQYHPEFDFAHLETIHRLHGAELIAEGRFADQDALERHCGWLADLARDTGDAAAAQSLGIDAQVTDPKMRASEIAAWLEACVLV